MNLKEIPTSANTLENNWSVAVAICPTDQKIHGNSWKMQAGVDFLKSEKPEIIPWIWCRGGERTEEKLAAVLGDKVKGRSQDLDLKVGLGAVALERIPLVPDNLDGFDIDRDGLLEQIRNSFEKFTQHNLNILFPE